MQCDILSSSNSENDSEELDSVEELESDLDLSPYDNLN